MQGDVWPNTCTGPVEIVNQRVQAWLANNMDSTPGVGWWTQRRLLFADFSDILVEAFQQVVLVRSPQH